jgi:tight adherence protein B
MNGLSLPIVLLLLACLSLVGLGLSSILVSKGQRSRERLQMRFALVTSPHARLRRIELSAFTRAAPTQQSRSSAAIALAFLKIELDKPELYPVAWWLVLLVAVVIANFARMLAEPLLGGLSFAVLPACWLMLSRAYFTWAGERQRKKLLNQFPDALAMIVRSVRVGIPVMEAVRAVARELPEPTAKHFDTLVNDVAVGKTLEDAVVDMSRRSGLPEYRFFATALALQNQTGGTLSDTLESLADVIRKRKALKDKGFAMTAEARMSSLVLAVMPVLMGGMLWLMNPAYMDQLFNTATGKKLLGIGVVLMFLGLFSIRTIIRKTLP